jgi:flagellar biosynthesis/type III secretory pathway ATPase
VSLAPVVAGLLERAANDAHATLTAVYTVLVEGDARDDPVAEETRALLDGHIVLDPALAGAGHFPAVRIDRSVSRCMGDLVTPTHAQAAATLRSWLAAREKQADLVAVGAYQTGADPAADAAIQRRAAIQALLCQRPDETAAFDATIRQLIQVVRP